MAVELPDASYQSAKVPPPDGGDGAREPRRLDAIITPEDLKMISKASGNFSFHEDSKLPPGRVGYTNKDTKAVYINPLYLHGSEEAGVEPMSDEAIKGFLRHEAGHHAPEVLAFDDRLIRDLGNPDIVPESYRGSPTAEARFFRSLYSHLDNALVDMWLEAYSSRRPFAPVARDIESLYTSVGVAESWIGMSKPEQLMQALLISRYFDVPDTDMAQKMESSVWESYLHIRESGAMGALLDKRAFENYFATDRDRTTAIGRKVEAYKQVFLPEYLKLLEEELEDRKQAMQQQKGQSGKPQRGQGGDPAGDSVPLTKEEEEQLIDQILKELEEMGNERGHCHETDSDQDKQQQNEMFDRIRDRLKKIREGKETPEQDDGQLKEKKGMDAISDRARDLQKERERKERGKLADSLQVQEASIAQWKAIKEKYRRQIDSLAGDLAQIFLDDRRQRTEFMKREGEIVPGLEQETISALLSGDTDPDTKMRQVRNLQFLKTELEFIVDTSGSMSGEKLQKSVELMVVTTEAFKQVLESLEAEDLILPDETPFKIGVTKFSDAAERVTDLDEPLDDAKQIRIIDRASQVGGGTEETQAIIDVYKGMTLRSNDFLKMIVVLTDGYGNQEGVAPIIQKVEQDDEVVFLAVGLGESQEQAEGVTATYLGPLSDREKNVFAITAVDPDTILPQVVEFLRREVYKHQPVL